MARCHTFTTMHSPHRILSPGVPEPQTVTSLRVRTKRIPKNISHIPIWAILPCERVHGSTIVLHVPAANLYVFSWATTGCTVNDVNWDQIEGYISNSIRFDDVSRVILIDLDATASAHKKYLTPSL